MLKEGLTAKETTWRTSVEGDALGDEVEEEELEEEVDGVLVGTVPFAMSFKQYPPVESFVQTLAVRGRRV
jgi:hypothetical protein